MSVRLRQVGSLEQLRRHNLHLVLRTIYSGVAESRAELSVVTGLTKPTVSTLVGELLEEGLISERGPGRSSESGGKRPTLLQFEPRARQVIGVSVIGNRALGALSDLTGETSALHVRELAPGEDVVVDGATVVADVVAGLLPQLDAPLLGIGVGLPGASGSPTLAASLSRRFGVNVHLGNQAELSALGQLAFADGVDPGDTLVNLIVDGGIEMGVGMAGGAVHYGSDLSDLNWPPGSANGPSNGPLRDRLAWGELQRRVEAALMGETVGGGALTRQVGDAEPAPYSYLRLKDAASRGNLAAAALVDEVARDLALIVAWLVASVRPTQVSLGGRLSDLGDSFLELLRHHVAAHLPAKQLEDVAFGLAYSDQLGAMGAVALVMQAELELLGS